jgi:hypothetical protein
MLYRKTCNTSLRLVLLSALLLGLGACGGGKGSPPM